MSETTAITNRQRLLADLTALSSEALFEMIWNGGAGNILDYKVCEDCKAMHEAPCPEDGPCPLSHSDWMEMPCRHEHLIVEGDAP